MTSQEREKDWARLGGSRDDTSTDMAFISVIINQKAIQHNVTDALLVTSKSVWDAVDARFSVVTGEQTEI